MDPFSPNQPRRSATTCLFWHPGHVTSTTPSSYACLDILFADRVSHTVHVKTIRRSRVDPGVRGGGEDGGDGEETCVRSLVVVVVVVVTVGQL